MIQALAIAGFSFVLYALSSLAWAPATNWLAVANLLAMVGAFFLGANLRFPQQVWVPYLWALTAAVPAYWLFPAINPNAFGAALAVGIAAALSYRWWPFLPIGLAGVLYTGSRGSIAATGVVCFVGAVRRFPTAAWTILAGTVIAIALRHPTFDSLYARLGVWEDTINHLTLFGSGLGSFAEAYASWPVHRNMSGALAPHAYNDYLELLFELGIGAIPGLVFLTLCLSGDGPKLPVLAFIICGLSFFPLSIPILAQAFAFSLGQLARSYNGTLETYRPSLPHG